MAKSNIVNTFKKIEDTVVGAYNTIEETVVGGYRKVEDTFVDNYLTKDGESVEEAKARLKQEQEDLSEKNRKLMEQSIESSINAGKRNWLTGGNKKYTQKIYHHRWGQTRTAETDRCLYHSEGNGDGTYCRYIEQPYSWAWYVYDNGVGRRSDAARNTHRSSRTYRCCNGLSDTSHSYKTRKGESCL